MKQLLFLLIVVFGLTSCRSVDKYVRKGNFDDAIDYALKKLSSNKGLKTKDVRAMEFAFQKIKMSEERDIRNKYSSARSHWGSIYRDIQNIDRLQKQVAPFLPIVSKEGYTAQFKFINVGKLQEKALFEANQRDLKEIKQLARSTDAQKQMIVFKLYERIENRQRFVLNNPKIIGVEGYVPDYKFAEVSDRIDTAKKQALESMYAKAAMILDKASGNKNDAREAYYLLKEIKEIDPSFRQVETLINQARDMGTVHVKVLLKNHSYTLIPRELQNYVLSTDFSDLNDNWITYYTDNTDRKNVDVEAIIDLVRLDISPERESVNAELIAEEIVDGWEYELDGNGNVKKDSLGNDIKIDRYVMIDGEFITIRRSKHATITGAIKYRHTDTGKSISGKPINVEYVFDDESYDFRGDKRVLTSDMKRDLQKRIAPFPTDLDVTMAAGNILREELRREMKRAKFLDRWYN